jgi:D-alanyl-D-alanine endopeptidase (penicillin-binding protein 7)
MSKQPHRPVKNLLLVCCLSAGTLATVTLAREASEQLAALQPDSGSRQTPATNPWSVLNPKKLKVRSASALVLDESGNVVYDKRADEPRPIASVTKLMTAMVILDSGLALDERITVTKDDRDLRRLTGSRLEYGATLTREEMLRLALMASENRAAAALARTYPGGRKAFARAMNRKASELDMAHSHFVDAAGLDAGNVASARDVAKMVLAAQGYALIRSATTTRTISVHPYKGRGELRYGNTNRLLRNKSWEIHLSKTGYINEAGRCLVMQADIAEQPLVIVLLNSFGKLTPFGDSNRIRDWIEGGISS